jgi:ectoine hydroxylase-related dioxygenase (phytanoyl-CoA dioxygenase family)
MPEQTVRHQLSSQQVASYRENGFLVIDDFLDAAEVERLREILARYISDRGVPADDRQRRHDVHHVNVSRTDERLRAFSLDPGPCGLACQLGDVDAVRLYDDRAVIKPAWGEPTGWHIEAASLAFTHPGATTFWFALADTGLRNGCPYYIAGSHEARLATRGNSRLDGLRVLNPDWEPLEPVPCEVSAGALIVHSVHTARASSMNITPWQCPSYSITWMPDGATFNGMPDGLPDEVLATLQVGARLDLDHLFPVAHRR